MNIKRRKLYKFNKKVRINFDNEEKGVKEKTDIHVGR